MKIKEILGEGQSKKRMQLIIEFVGNDPLRFEELMNLYFKGPYQITQRASWAISDIAVKDPTRILPYLSKMIEMLDDDSHHIAVKRNTIRILQFVEIPEDFLGILADKCFRYLMNHDEAIAVRAFSITVLYNIVRRVPELKRELIMILEEIIPTASSGLRNRAQKALKMLEG